MYAPCFLFLCGSEESTRSLTLCAQCRHKYAIYVARVCVCTLVQIYMYIPRKASTRFCVWMFGLVHRYTYHSRIHVNVQFVHTYILLGTRAHVFPYPYTCTSILFIRQNAVVCFPVSLHIEILLLHCQIYSFSSPHPWTPPPTLRYFFHKNAWFHERSSRVRNSLSTIQLNDQ